MHRIRILCLKAANGHGAASGILSGILIKQSLSKTLGPYSTASYGLYLLIGLSQSWTKFVLGLEIVFYNGFIYINF